MDLPIEAEPVPADEAAAPVIEEVTAPAQFTIVEGVPTSLPSYLDSLERDAIRRALERTRYNRTAAAQLLGITFRQLRYRMQRLAIQ
jgi:two-component system response regulator PilR (NtrC family)